MANWKGNIIFKKGRKWIYDSTRVRTINHKEKPFLINSIPKSGTHLLHQITSILDLVDYGGFIASTPSFTMRECIDKKIEHKLKRLYNKELMSSHVFYSPSIEKTLINIGIPTIFIYRDPRDIFLSEINYLSNMNRWHKLHRYYANCESFDEKFELCLNGIQEEDVYYPCFKERINRYVAWVDSEACLSVSFERLRESKYINDELLRIGKYVIDKSMWFESADEFISKGRRAIQPQKSHTFSGGLSRRWEKELDLGQQNHLRKNLGGIIYQMGYE